MTRFWLSVCLFISMSFMMTGKVVAHPHVWVDSQYNVTVDQAHVSELEGTWSLDLFTSISLIAEYDVDGDGVFTGQERIAITEVLKSFEHYGFFIKMKQDGVEIKPSKVDVLDVGIREQMLWVRLGIGLENPIDLELSTLSLAYGDDELYFAMEPLEEGLVRLSGLMSEICTPIERETEETAVAFWVDLSCSS